MREHGCRYGFIMTEIEMLCVRAGADDAAYAAAQRQHCGTGADGAPVPQGVDEGPRPVFGMLETATPISLSAAGPHPDSGAPRLTPALALWFLHMLAKDNPLPGCPPWKMAVGGPAALSRQHFAERDSWMPKVAVHESRVAKRLRGWVWPDEQFSRKEAPNPRRRGNV
jgi:hypothetical protein